MSLLTFSFSTPSPNSPTLPPPIIFTFLPGRMFVVPLNLVGSTYAPLPPPFRAMGSPGTPRREERPDFEGGRDDSSRRFVVGEVKA